MCRGQDERTVLYVEEGVAECLDAAGLFPELDRTQRREKKFLSADPVHFLTDDPNDLSEDLLRQRKKHVDSRRQRAHHSGADHQLVTWNCGVRGNLFDGGNETLTQAHEV